MFFANMRIFILMGILHIGSSWSEFEHSGSGEGIDSDDEDYNFGESELLETPNQGGLKEEILTGPHCITLETCPIRSQPCGNTKTPKKANGNFFQQLKLVCPELVKEFGDKVCCNVNQFQRLQINVEHALEDSSNFCCSTIFRNLACHVVCSPVQSDFIKVLGARGFQRVEVAIAKEFAQATLASCLDLDYFPKYPSTTSGNGTLLLESQDDSTQKLFDHWGATESGFSSFGMNFTIVGGNVKEEGEGAGLSKNYKQPFNYSVEQCTDLVDLRGDIAEYEPGQNETNNTDIKSGCFGLHSQFYLSSNVIKYFVIVKFLQLVIIHH